MTHKRLIFDNGGGTTVQIGDWAHYFNSPEDAAEAVIDYRRTGTTEGWEGNEKDAVIFDPYNDPINYKIWDIGDDTDVDYRYSWRNAEIFFDTIDNTVVMQCTRREACDQVAKFIRDYYISPNSYNCLVITKDGTIDVVFNGSNHDNIFIVLDDNIDEWKYGELENIDDEGSWTDEVVKALSDCFYDDWLSTSIANTDVNEVIWRKE